MCLSHRKSGTPGVTENPLKSRRNIIDINMKKYILIIAMLFFVGNCLADAQNLPKKEVRKIVNALDGADGTCYTADGERGTRLPNSSSRTTTSGSSNTSSNSYSNSRSNGASASATFEAGTRNVGGSVTGAMSTSSSSSKSKGSSTTKNQESSSTVNYICVPDSKRWK